MKWVEFYPEKQGRPASPSAQDLDARTPNISYNYFRTITISILEDEMKAELNELISKVAEALIELRQIKLHLASVSDETTEAGDGEE